MSVFPFITKSEQELYEKVCLKHPCLQNNVPKICGYYGRACKQMNGHSGRAMCRGCTLCVFISIVEATMERCNEKEALGIQKLYDSDICNIQEKLKEKTIDVDFSYIERVLECLTQ